MTAGLPDAGVREEVLDPARSFLVQAPAGAGKTELLIRRYLRLLALAEEPEEILAITFTRKAAAEMRRRVLEALAPAAEAGAGDASVTATLARAVRARDEARDWHLLEQPARLRIGTIDGLNSALARAAPLSSGASVLRKITDSPGLLYEEAASRLLDILGEPGPAGDALAGFLGHLDNRVSRLRDLLALLLERREQWLPVLGSGGADPVALKARLEAGLRRVVVRRVSEFVERWPGELQPAVREVVCGAAEVLEVALPPADSDIPEEQLAWWRFAGTVLLTQKGQWRTAPNKRQGIPPGQAKQKALDLLVALAGYPGLDRALADVGALPDPRYGPGQWRALEALVRVLPLAAAQLRVVFADEGVTDYTEIAADALVALGSEGAPGDPALGLDARIRHLLMDEFQDTSQAQYALLAALTRGWEAGDGRTVFLVGDPMQSIYRFRQAEVRLFLGARDQGLPQVPLEFRRLTTNFRSVPAVVDWVNEVFARVLPVRDDPLVSAVAYAPSTARRPPDADSGVACHDLTGVGAGPPEEGARVAALVADCLARWPDDTVGILVRSRTQAAATLKALVARDIPFEAVEQLHLGDSSLAADLLALTRALVNDGDRLAWLAVLRAPWCGLTLADLAAVAEGQRHVPIPHLLEKQLAGTGNVPGQVSDDGRQRIARLLAAFGRAWSRRGQVALQDLVEGLWLELGGPACAGPELAFADELFRIIGTHDRGGDCPDPGALAEDLARKPATLGASGARVQVLTIHKAKGLEFDTVIVPGLGAAVRGDARPALLWEEVPVPGGGPELLLAPVNATEADNDPLYELLWKLRQEQGRAEDDRLLYVAATRAVRRLHLVGSCRTSADGDVRPPPGSLLARLWPGVEAQWRAAMTGSTALDAGVPEGDDGGAANPGSAEPDPVAEWYQPPLARLPADWARPSPPPPVAWAELPAEGPRSEVIFDWAGHGARHAGTVVHRWLQHLATVGLDEFTPERIAGLLPRFQRDLAALGVDPGELPRAAARVRDALVRTLEDPRGRWLLGRDHADIRSEWAVTVAGPSGFRRLVVDRAFVDREGRRWIVDYKTSSHEGGDEEGFLRQEADRYREQLARYREAFEALEDRPVRTALYFPLLGRLLEL